jgi:hypothetical protein
VAHRWHRAVKDGVVERMNDISESKDAVKIPLAGKPVKTNTPLQSDSPEGENRLSLSTLSSSSAELRQIQKERAEIKKHVDAAKGVFDWGKGNKAANGVLTDLENTYNWDAAEKVTQKLPWMITAHSEDKRVLAEIQKLRDKKFEMIKVPANDRGLPLYLLVSEEAAQTLDKYVRRNATGLTSVQNRFDGSTYLDGLYMASPEGVARKMMIQLHGKNGENSWEKHWLRDIVHEDLHRRGHGEIVAELGGAMVGRQLGISSDVVDGASAVKTLTREGYSRVLIAAGLVDFHNMKITPELFQQLPPPGKPLAEYILTSGTGNVIKYKQPVPITVQEEEVRTGIRIAARNAAKIELAGTLNITDQKLLSKTYVKALEYETMFMNAYRAYHGREQLAGDSPVTFLAAAG